MQEKCAVFAYSSFTTKMREFEEGVNGLLSRPGVQVTRVFQSSAPENTIGRNVPEGHLAVSTHVTIFYTEYDGSSQSE